MLNTFKNFKFSSFAKSSVGFIAISFMLSALFLALFCIFYFSFGYENEILIDRFIISVIIFTFYQALLSTILSLIFALTLAKALYNFEFFGKNFILKILSATFFLPSLVAIAGIFTVYGKSGMIAQILHFFGLNYNFKIYGIFGILLAHIFLNFPFATKIIYQALSEIPTENRKLADILGLNFWQTFKILELPTILKQIIPTCGLIFMLCFSSFAIVLTLGGSPKYTTIEVAIYQSIRDFDLTQAGVLALLQLIIGFIFLTLLNLVTSKKQVNLKFSSEVYQKSLSKKIKIISFFITFILLSFILTPIIGIIFQGFKNFSLSFLNPIFFKALFTSIFIALISASLAMFLSILIIISNNNLLNNSKKFASSLLLLLSSTPLAIPNMITSAGLFIFFYTYLGSSKIVIFSLIVVSNSLISLPFIIKQISFTSSNLSQKSNLSCQILGINLINYLFLIEFAALKKIYLYSFAFSTIMSIGDFGIIAFFGNDGIITLPYYLYELLGRYKESEANFIALILLIINIFTITIFNEKGYKRDRA